MSIENDFSKYDNLSIRELEEVYLEVENKRKIYYNMEQAIKLVLNSIYGAFGNEYFYFFNIDMAEAVTLQGQDAILYSEKMLNRYFLEAWHNDKEVHKKLGITVKGKILKPVSIYIDTDSVDSKTLIKTELGELTIEKYFEYLSNLYTVYKDNRGNELIDLNYKHTVLNYNDTEIVNTPIKKLIRHKVTKDKWKLKTKSGKEIIVTNDHSLIIFREGKKIEIKAKDINIKTDKILSILFDDKYQFEEIESCEYIGKFENEYVYDIEVDDKTHTFIANDILVHNSVYISLGEVLDKTDWTGTDVDFALKLYEYRLKGYIESFMNFYAKNMNSDNFLIFEMESIAKKGIWLAKKNYIQDIIWKDPDIHFESLTKIKTKGFDTIKSSTPIFARDRLNKLIKYVLSTDDIKLTELVKMLKEIKKEFKLTNIENICFNLRVGDYKKYIINDYKDLTFEKGCPLHTRGSGYHNYLLNNSKYKNKYSLIKDSDKVRCYLTDDPINDNFSFLPGSFPYEIAPKINYDKQFEKVIIDPFNRILEALELQTLDKNLIYSSSIF